MPVYNEQATVHEALKRLLKSACPASRGAAGRRRQHRRDADIVTGFDDRGTRDPHPQPRQGRRRPTAIAAATGEYA